MEKTPTACAGDDLSLVNFFFLQTPLKGADECVGVTEGWEARDYPKLW